MSKKIALNLQQISGDLRDIVEKHWSNLSDTLMREGLESIFMAFPERVFSELPQVLLGSDFVADYIICNPMTFSELVADSSFWKSYDESDYSNKLQRFLGTKEISEIEFNQKIRQFRNREYVRIIWRDLSRLSTLSEIMRDLSLLAEAAVAVCVQYHYELLVRKYGVPMSQEQASESASVQELIVLAMGKLGARELNLSSDIDLIFAYPKAGTTRHRDNSISNQVFFTRLGQRVIQSLSNITAQGFVFRVDMRLRPYGSSGDLVMHYDAMESYYQAQGRSWERYALIKARVITGNSVYANEILKRLTPFVYRAYVDFGAIEELRNMKKLIHREVLRKQEVDNIKLGTGGIREIEFIVQAFQLIHGGRAVDLQVHALSEAMLVIEHLGMLPQLVIDELTAAYGFLRETEHRLQALSDRQTHVLPKDRIERLRLAFSMGYGDWSSYFKSLEKHRGRVRKHFEDMVRPEQKQQTGMQSDQQQLELYQAWWLQELSDQQVMTLLETVLKEVRLTVIEHVRAFRSGNIWKKAQLLGQHRLDRLMPEFLYQAMQQPQPDVVIMRVLPIFEQILRRSAYITLLVEHPVALRRLMGLCAASLWVAEQLRQFPILFDELLYEERMFVEPISVDFNDILRQQLSRVTEDDLESQMEILRYFKSAHVLHMAIAELRQFLSLTDISRYLTDIAETTVNTVADLAWTQLIHKYGVPQNALGEPCEKCFIIVAYGKMGAREMGYGSDLDLVFLYDADPALSTNGDVSVENSVFFARMAQRIVHILSTTTYGGRLYEVDTRLRPSGESGFLVNTVNYFHKYMLSTAWTWEHQAFVRARAVAGSNVLRQKFEQIRAQILTMPRSKDSLRSDVIAMREKMIQHLGSSARSSTFDLKQDKGGILDIEFIVQYGVLLKAREHECLLKCWETLSALKAFAEIGLLCVEDVALLEEAYRAYRSRARLLVLQNQKPRVDKLDFKDFRENVRFVWKRFVQGMVTK